MDLGRASRSTRAKNAKYREFSESDSESVQSEYEKGEAIFRADDSSETDTDSEEKTIMQVVNEKKNDNVSYIGRRICKEFEGKDYIGFVTGTDVLTEGRNKGKRLFTVSYTDGDAEDLFVEEIEELLLPEEYDPANAAAASAASTTPTSTKVTKAKKKKKEFVKLSKKKMFCLLDVETTGSKRNWDMAIVYAWMIVNEEGHIIDEREFRVHPGRVRIKEAAYRTHKISRQDLIAEDKFDVVGPRMSAWLSSHLHSVDAGVLVAHNGSTDFQFLCAAYVRHGLPLPPKLTHTLDTLSLLRRFSSLGYRKASVGEWTELTKTGKPSLSVNACATYTLSKRTPPTDFETVCGMHHDAMADVRGIAIIMFDWDELGTKGLQHLIQQQSRPLFEKLQTVWDAMVEKCSEPPIIMKPVPAGWLEHESSDEEGQVQQIKSGSAKLPAGIEPAPEPEFTGRGARNPGGATPQLKRFLRNAGVHSGTRGTPVDKDPTSLLTQIFLFFFEITFLLHICLCTNAHATEPIVKERYTDEHGKRRTRYRPAKPGEQPTGPRCCGWKPLWPGELLVFIGITFKMGVLWRPRVRHYWSKRVGFADPIIKSSMTGKRYQQIYANLTFAIPGTASGYAKIKMVDEYLQQRCQLAMFLTQHFAVDESMIRCLSRFCSWKQFMARKPIKWGIKVFCLVLSTGFLWNWHIYRGKGDTVLKAQVQSAMYHLIFVVLLCSSDFDHRGCVLFCDAAFTSLKLFSDLFTKRGIRAVGPINLGKGVANNTADTWPFQPFTKQHGEYLWRGWDRVAYKKLTSTPPGYLQALVWKDNKFVTILATCYIEAAKKKCKRWIRALKRYDDNVVVRLCLILYAVHMGHVDRCDKNIALSKIKPRRCKKRYHRAVFYWLLAAVGFNNVLAVFMALFPNAQEFEKKQNRGSIGFKYWAQDEMANSLIKLGLKLAGKRKVQTAALMITKFWRWCTKRQERLRHVVEHMGLRAGAMPAHLTRFNKGKRLMHAVSASRLQREEFINYSPTFQPGDKHAHTTSTSHIKTHSHCINHMHTHTTCTPYMLPDIIHTHTP